MAEREEKRGERKGRERERERERARARRKGTFVTFLGTLVTYNRALL